MLGSGSGLVGFRATRPPAATPQVFQSNMYAKILFDYVRVDTSSRYDANLNRWTPVPIGEGPNFVIMSGLVWITGGAEYRGGYGAQFVVKTIKNGNPIGGGAYAGTDVFTGIGLPNPAMPGTVAIPWTGMDMAMPGDYYETILYATAAPVDDNPPFPSIVTNSIQLDINPYHLFWCGALMPRGPIV